MKKIITKETLMEDIAKCDRIIQKQEEKKTKLQSRLAEMRKTEILNAIMKSDKTLEEVLAFVNS